MEWFGLIAFIIVCCSLSYPDKVKKLQKEIKKIKKSSREEMKMSNIITSLIGNSCKITVAEGFQTVENAIVLDADAEWVKIEKINKKNVKSIQIIRIDDIYKIELEEQ